MSVGKILSSAEAVDLKNLPEFKSLCKSKIFSNKTIENITPSDFFIKAGEKGILLGYELAAAYEKKLGNKTRAEQLYLLQGEKGDPDGYFNLACLHEKEGQYEESVKYYEKADFFVGGLLQAARLHEFNNNLQKSNELRELSKTRQNKFFEDLKSFMDSSDEE